jgi:hypothetical protein
MTLFLTPRPQDITLYERDNLQGRVAFECSEVVSRCSLKFFANQNHVNENALLELTFTDFSVLYLEPFTLGPRNLSELEKHRLRLTPTGYCFYEFSVGQQTFYTGKFVQTKEANACMDVTMKINPTRLVLSEVEGTTLEGEQFLDKPIVIAGINANGEVVALRVDEVGRLLVAGLGGEDVALTQQQVQDAVVAAINQLGLTPLGLEQLNFQVKGKDALGFETLENPVLIAGKSVNQTLATLTIQPDGSLQVLPVAYQETQGENNPLRLDADGNLKVALSGGNAVEGRTVVFQGTVTGLNAILDTAAVWQKYRVYELQLYVNTSSQTLLTQLEFGTGLKIYRRVNNGNENLFTQVLPTDTYTASATTQVHYLVVCHPTGKFYVSSNQPEETTVVLYGLDKFDPNQYPL